MQWYYSKNGSQLGPVSTEDLKAKLGTGEVTTTDLVWKEGMADWLPAHQVGELTAVAVIPTPDGGTDAGQAPVSPYTPPSSPYSPPLAQPGPITPGGPPFQPNCAKATTAMTLGICAIVLSLCCPLIGLVLGILAVVFGGQAKQEIARNPQWAADQGKANAAVIMGWISIPLAVVVGAISVVVQLGRIGSMR